MKAPNVKKIGKAEFNLDALQGITKEEFLKPKSHTEAQWKILKPLVTKKAKSDTPVSN